MVVVKLMSELEAQTAGMQKVSEPAMRFSQLLVFHSRHKTYSLKRHFLLEIVTGFEKNNPFQAFFAHC